MALTLASIRPEPSERAIFLGATGSGKTTLAARLLKPLPFVVAIDPKGMLGSDKERGRTHLQGYTLVRDPNQLAEAKASHIQYRPAPEYLTMDWWESVFRWVYDRRNTTLYVDELNLVIEGYQPPDAYKACVQCGRERGVGVWNATQRPAGVPQIAMTEAESMFAFILRNDRDRKACVDANLDEIIRDKPIRENYWFYHAGPRSRGTRLLRLTLGGKLVGTAS